MGRGGEVLFYRRTAKQTPELAAVLGKGVPGGGQSESEGLEEGALLVGLRHSKSQSGWRTEQKGTKSETGTLQGSGISSADDGSP